VFFHLAEVSFSLVFFTPFGYKAMVSQNPVYSGMTDGKLKFIFEMRRPHKRETLSQLDYPSGNDRACFMRAVMRDFRQVNQTCQFLLLVSTQPLSDGFGRSCKASGCRLYAVTGCVMNYPQSQIELAGGVFHSYNLLPIGQRIHCTGSLKGR